MSKNGGRFNIAQHTFSTMSTVTAVTSKSIILLTLIVVLLLGLVTAGYSSELVGQTEEKLVVYGPKEAPSQFDQIATTQSISYEELSPDVQTAFRSKQAALYSDDLDAESSVELAVDPSESQITEQVVALDGEYYYFATEDRITPRSEAVGIAVVLSAIVAGILGIGVTYELPKHITMYLSSAFDLTIGKAGLITIIGLCVIGLVMSVPLLGFSSTEYKTTTTQVNLEDAGIAEDQIISFEALSDTQKEVFVNSISNEQIDNIQLQHNLGEPLYIQSDGEVYRVETTTLSTTNLDYLIVFFYFLMLPYLGIKTLSKNIQSNSNPSIGETVKS